MTGWISIQAYSQDTYSSTRGVAVIEGTWNGNPVKTEGLKVEAQLNYETAQIILELLSPVIHTGMKALDLQLDTVNLQNIRFEGKLNIDVVQTQNHPLQTFEVEGQLKGPGWNFPVHGEGILEHTYYDTYACMLSLNFHVNVSDWDLPYELSGLGSEIYIRLMNAVLKNEY